MDAAELRAELAEEQRELRWSITWTVLTGVGLAAGLVAGWTGLDAVMVPIDEVVVARWGDEVVDLLSRLDPSRPLIAVGSDGAISAVVPPRRIREVLEI